MENIFIIYAFKVSISLVLFYTLYIFLFRGDTFFRVRRIYLLFTLLFSFIFPFLKIDFTEKEIANIPEYLFLLQGFDVVPIEVNPQSENSISWETLFILMSVIVSILLIGRLLHQLYSIAKIKKEGNSIKFNNYRVITSKKETVLCFSFFNWIFINPRTQDESQLSEIMAHEVVHARQWHSIDVLISELVCILCWWNPVVWLLRKEIRINLEYLADAGVLNAGFESRHYQYSLLQVSNNENTAVSIINHFNVSQLKKRIIMMNKKKTQSLFRAKYLMSLPLMMALLLANTLTDSTLLASGIENPIAQELPALLLENTLTDSAPLVPNAEKSVVREPSNNQSVKQSNSKQVVVIKRKVDVMPQFVGGTEALNKYIYENLKYPAEAVAQGVQGRVDVKFIVKADGSITDAEITRGIDSACDQEALRVINGMPKWEPGKKDGVNVAVSFVLPIEFRMLNKNLSEGLKFSGTDMSKILVVLDGKVIDSNKMNSLRHDDIKSVSVLKTGDLAQMYKEYTEDMEGIILITSKK